MAKSDSPLARVNKVTSQALPTASVDEKDLELLRELSVDARQSHRGLGRKVGLSAPAVSERIGRLERVGVIRRYSVRVDWSALGYQVVAHLAVTVTPGSDLAEVILGLRAIAEIEDISVVTGSIDFLVRLRARDHAHLRELLVNEVFLVEGIARTETYLSLGENEPERFTTELLDQLRSSGDLPRGVRDNKDYQNGSSPIQHRKETST